MKLTVATWALLLLFGSASCLAEGFRLELGHFDRTGGPLTVDTVSNVPLTDGCLGQVIVNLGNDGIAPPQPDGMPGEGDALLQFPGYNGEPAGGCFTVNGEALFGLAGFYFVDPELAADTLPRHAIYLRVWNAADPLTATGYWDSPLYELIAGTQQVNFLRAEWQWHPADPTSPAGKPGEDGDPVELATDIALKAFPNPFNATARLQFSLAEPHQVRLQVYDVAGRLVRTLTDGVIPAGMHTLSFDAGSLPSGVYFLSMAVSGRMTQVQRLLLVR